MYIISLSLSPTNTPATLLHISQFTAANFLRLFRSSCSAITLAFSDAVMALLILGAWLGFSFFAPLVLPSLHFVPDEKYRLAGSSVLLLT